MPIRPELRHHYGREWRALSLELKRAARWSCEWCGRRQGEWAYRRGQEPAAEQYALFPVGTDKYQVVLTVAHLNHAPWDNRRANLRVLCQRCHLAHDAPHHAANAAITRARKVDEAHRRAGQLRLV